MRVLWTAGSILLLSAVNALAQSPDPAGWGACSAAIRSYIGDRHSSIYRVRLWDKELKGDAVVFEIGEPGDKKPSIDSTWQMRLHPDNAIHRAELVVGVQRAGWVVFRDVSTNDRAVIEQFLFSPWESECRTMGPKGASEYADLPHPVVAELSAMAKDRSKGRQPTQDPVREGTFIKTEDDFDRSTDRDEQVKAVLRATPKEIYPAILALDELCRGDGAVDGGTFDKKFITAVDIDNDNDTDYILNDAHYFCLYPDKSAKSVGAENSANITIFSNTTKGMSQSLSLYSVSSELYQFDGFAVFSSVGTGKTPTAKRHVEIRRGRAKDTGSRPENGKLIYRSGGSSDRSRANLLSMLFGGDAVDNATSENERETEVAAAQAKQYLEKTDKAGGDTVDGRRAPIPAARRIRTGPKSLQRAVGTRARARPLSLRT